MANILQKVKNAFHSKEKSKIVNKESHSITVDERGINKVTDDESSMDKIKCVYYLDQLIQRSTYLYDEENIYYRQKTKKPDWMPEEEYIQQVQISSIKHYMTKIKMEEDECIVRIIAEVFDSPFKKGVYFYDIAITNISKIIAKSGFDLAYFSLDKLLTNVDILNSIEDKPLRDYLLLIFSDNLWRGDVHYGWDNDDKTKQTQKDMINNLDRGSVVETLKKIFSKKIIKIVKTNEELYIDDYGINEFVTNLTMEKLTCLAMLEVLMKSCTLVKESQNIYFQEKTPKPDDMSNEQYTELSKIVSFKHYFEKPVIDDTKFLVRISVRNYKSYNKKGLYFTDAIFTNLTGIDFNDNTLQSITDKITRDICVEMLAQGSKFFYD